MFEVSAAQKNAFRESANRVYLDETGRGSTIGVQGERMLHAILKHYLCPDETCHEVRVGRFWADVKEGSHIREIQTRRFDRLRTKLAAFLPTYEVTVVYPIAVSKTLSWLNPEDGTLTRPRKSSARRTVYDSFYELFFIREFLTHPHFHFCAILCEMQEFRSLTGYGKSKKIRAPRIERIPSSLEGEAHFNTPADYAALIPEQLGEQFTTPEFARAARIPASAAWRAMQVLLSLGLVRETGKRGNAKLWQRQEVMDGAPV